jgi:hypothetical protein
MDLGEKGGALEALYHFCEGAAVSTLRVQLPREGCPEIASVSEQIPVASFFERELGKLELPPFDAPEAETEIVAGALTEYSGRGLALFHIGKSVELVVAVSLVTAFYLGGDRQSVDFYSQNVDHPAMYGDAPISAHPFADRSNGRDVVAVWGGVCPAPNFGDDFVQRMAVMKLGSMFKDIIKSFFTAPITENGSLGFTVTLRQM